MIDVKLLEKKSDTGVSYFDLYRTALINRKSSTEALEALMALNQKRKEAITQAESAKANQNKVSGEIAKMKREGKDASAMIAEMGKLSASIKDLEAQAAKADAEVLELALTLPNKPHESVPVGADETHNRVMKTFMEPTKLGFTPVEHGDLGAKLNVLDFERAGKVTGARFTFLMGMAARLERALISFMMDLHSQQHGYREVIPPYIVNSASLTGTGQFPKFKEDVFNLSGTDYYLIPTAEVPLTNLYREEILKEEQLPAQFVGFSPCFRSEAGSHGRDVKGLIRQHQFHKVELMVFAHPEKSYEVLESLTSHAERVLELLQLPYRRVLLCTGDMGFGSAKTFDLEVWLPSQQTYREISSCSNFEDFQARRANIRFRPSAGGKPQFVHTLNGSALAVGRTLVAIFENYQQADGSIRVPEVLQSYMGGVKVIQGE